MAEISQSESCNFFPPARFQSIDGGSDERAKKSRTAKLLDLDEERSWASLALGGGYEIRKVSSIAGGSGGSGDSNGVLTGAGQRWHRRRSGRRCRGTGSSLCLWLLRILSVRLRAVRLLRSRLVCRKRVRRGGPLVPWPRLAWKLGLGEWMARSSMVRSSGLGVPWRLDAWI